MGRNLSDLDKLEEEERRGQEVDRAENQAKQQQAAAHQNSQDGTWTTGGEEEKTPWHARTLRTAEARQVRRSPQLRGI